jgi:hypothetical protein
MVAVVPAVRADDEGSSASDDSSSGSSESSSDSSGESEQPAAREPVDSTATPASPSSASTSAPAPEATDIARPVKRKSEAERQAIETVGDTRRIQLFLVPIGENATREISAAQLALESEVNRLPGYAPVDLVEELAGPLPPGMVSKVEEARHAAQDGKAQLSTSQYVEATNRFRHAVELLSESAPATTPTELAEVMVRQAVGLLYSGDDEKAREVLRSAARIDLAARVDAKKVDNILGSELDGARKEIAKGLTGSLTVITTPPGSRVFIGGVYRGTTPVTVEGLPVGKNFVRIDRPGAQIRAQLAEVKPAADVTLREKMAFTTEATELQGDLHQLPTVLDRDKGLPDLIRAVGRRFHLARVVVATLQKSRAERSTVRLAVFDMAKEVRLADERGIFSSDPDALREQAATWARGVFDRADGSRNRSAADPLNRSDGTEDWYAQKYKPKQKAKETDSAEASTAKPVDTAAQPEPKKKKKSGKGNLDSEDGTGDW